MVKWRRQLLQSTTAPLALLFVTPAVAQQNPGEMPKTSLDTASGSSVRQVREAPTSDAARPADLSSDIVVTARRVEERLQDVPISITVFNQVQISERNIVTAGDLGIYTPSLAINTSFGVNSASFAIRGFTQETQTAPSVAVYFADVTAPRAQGGTTSGNGAGPGQFFDLQNVQVLKGPQGTLFGRNTTGGAVLLVPQKPTGQLEGYLEGSYGNYNMKRLQGVLNVPLLDTARLRIGADWQKRDGALRNRSGIGPRTFDDVDYYSIRASLVVDLTPTLENYTIGTYSLSHTNGFQPKIEICNPAPSGLVQSVFAPLACAQIARQQARGDRFWDVENGNTDPNERIEQWQLIDTATWQASDTLTLKNIASYAEFRQNQNFNLGGENFQFAPGVPTAFVGLYAASGLHNVSQYTMTEELQLQGRSANDRFTWQAGVYYEKSGPIGFQGSYSAILASCTNTLALQCSDPIGLGLARVLGLPAGSTPVGYVNISLSKYSFTDLAGYAQATYRLTKRLSLTGGFRYTSDRVSSVGEVEKILFPLPGRPRFTCNVTGVIASSIADCARSARESSQRPTWLIDLDYKPNEDLLLFAKYSRGYRQGGVNTSNPGFTGWGPEKVDDYEAGIKTTFRGAVRGTFNVTGFYDAFRDQQLGSNAINTPAGTPIQPIVNAGKSRIYGLEVDTSFNLTSSLRLDVGYAYLNTKLQSFTPPPFDPALYIGIVPNAAVGQSLTLSPRNRVTATGSYTLPTDEHVGQITLSATFTHTDKQIASAGSPIGTLQATNLVNLNLDWRNVLQSRLDLSLFVTNLTQEKYFTYVPGTYVNTGFESARLGQPRLFGARLRYRFTR